MGLIFGIKGIQIGKMLEKHEKKFKLADLSKDAKRYRVFTFIYGSITITHRGVMEALWRFCFPG